MEVMKQLRQRAIRDLVDQRPIRTQQELAGALRERGFRTTQATISRDVAELGLIKVSREGTQAYALPPRLIEAETSGEDRLRKLLADLPVEFHEAGLLLVMRTLPGSAHAIAAALDRARWPEVAGSIAGDDTLFVAFPDRGSLQRIKRRLIRSRRVTVTTTARSGRSASSRSGWAAGAASGWLRRRSEPAVEAVGYVDPSAVARAATIRAGAPPSRVFPDLETALRATEADAALVTTAIGFHVPLALQALAAGLHVLLEKPFAPTLDEAAERGARGGCRRAHADDQPELPAPSCAATGR